MSYSEDRIAQLLPSVWDRTYAWGMQNEQAADPDMPKMQYRSPKEATTFWTHLIDVRISWERAPITMFERRALLLHYGLGWTQQEIAEHQGVSRISIQKRLKKGVKTLADWLNADYITEHDDALIGTK